MSDIVTQMQPGRLYLFQNFADSAAFVFQIPIVGSVHFLLYNVRITGSALEFALWIGGGNLPPACGFSLARRRPAEVADVNQVYSGVTASMVTLIGTSLRGKATIVPTANLDVMRPCICSGYVLLVERALNMTLVAEDSAVAVRDVGIDKPRIVSDLARATKKAPLSAWRTKASGTP